MTSSRAPPPPAAPASDVGPVPSRHRHRAGVFRDLVALLHRRPLRDRNIPALHIGELVEVDFVPFETGDPRPGRDVRDGIIAGHEISALKPALEYAVKAQGLLVVALLGIRRLAGILPQEMVRLTDHRAD